MKKVNNSQAIQGFIETAGIDDNSVSEIVTQSEVIDGKTILYYTFKVFSPDTEDMFILATMLGHLYGPKNIWIDTYKATQKYLGYAKIEISVK